MEITRREGLRLLVLPGGLSTLPGVLVGCADEAGPGATGPRRSGTPVPAYLEVVVDRPFLFVIHDVAHGTPLFLGRVVDPTG